MRIFTCLSLVHSLPAFPLFDNVLCATCSLLYIKQETPKEIKRTGMGLQ
jgi:hypothetical protein